jgi:hypothetical protein
MEVAFYGIARGFTQASAAEEDFGIAIRSNCHPIVSSSSTDSKALLASTHSGTCCLRLDDSHSETTDGSGDQAQQHQYGDALKK